MLLSIFATVTLASCAKEIPVGQDSDPKAPAAEGSRVIAVSFAPQTKTSYTTTETGDIQPVFKGGESILLVAEPEDPAAFPDTQTVVVSVDPKTKAATITTKLSGNLKALYPAQMAEFAKDEFAIFVPAEQSGKFEDANICQAEISSGSKIAQFTNMYALFKIKSPDTSKSLTIKSLHTIGTNGQREGERQLINGNGGGTQ